MLTIALIKEAAARISGRIHRTPVLTSRSFNEATGKEVFFKCENLQRAGAFKIRGATNKILSLTNEEKTRGVAAFSSGNHAQAVALASREAGIRAIIAMPDDAPQGKVAATRAYGAEIVFYDRLKQDREGVAIEIAEREGRVMVPPYDDYFILAGQGTCGLEFVEEVPDLDCLLAPCSGGGLFAGVSTAAKALNPRIRCFPVEPESADDTRQSFLKGERISIPPPPTIADGLRVQSPGTLTFPVLQKTAEDVLTVSDDEIIETIRFFLFRMKLLVEPSGAAAAAAVMTGKLPRDTRRVGVVISGGNIDMNLISRIIETGLIQDGRLSRVAVIINDRPGNLARVTQCIADLGANILQISQTRGFGEMAIGETEVEFVLETAGPEHVERLHARLRQSGFVLKADS